MNTSQEMSRRISVITHVLLGVIGTAICCFFSMPCAVTVAAVSALTLAVHLWMQKRYSDKVNALCDEIDCILRGEDAMQLDLFREGELGILSSEIRKMTVRLREQNAMLKNEKAFLKESLEDISHQLRTPLTSVMLILSMLRNPALTRQQQSEAMQELSALLTRMQWLIEMLLSLSRLDAGAVQFRQEDVACCALVHAALEPLSIAMELKDISVKCEYDGDPVMTVDFAYCTEAVMNILKNCMEHTPEGGSISVHASENSIYTQILITDTGSGIAEADLPHIFERFYRASEFAKNGYGIGLSFAQKVVVSQGGSLQVRNAKNRGAQFDIRFYKAAI